MESPKEELKRTLFKKSQFWKRLAEEHMSDLQMFGFEQFKRRQALRYFTWRWHWTKLWKSEQMRFLLTHVSPFTLLRCAVVPMNLSDESWKGVPWRHQDRWLYTFTVRLLWEYTLPRDVLGVLNLPEPEVGNPFPVYWRGRLISQDLANTALECAALAKVLNGTGPTSILEVGAGYGRTAYALLKLFQGTTYTIVDIEPAIRISQGYLHQLFPDADIRFCSPEEATELPKASFDLVISISSLQEMLPEQLYGYLRLFNRLVRPNGNVYLKQWIEWQNPQDGVLFKFDELPVPANWRLLFKEQAPVQTRFYQGAWKVLP